MNRDGLERIGCGLIPGDAVYRELRLLLNISTKIPAIKPYLCTIEMGSAQATPRLLTIKFI